MSTSPALALAAEQHSATPARLRGRWLAAARASWIATAAICLMLVIFGTPIEFAGYQTPCAASCDRPQLTLAGAHELAALGISTTMYAAYNMTFELLFVAVWAAVAYAIFWRRSEEPLAWFVSLTLLTFGTAFPGFTEILWYDNHNIFWMVLSLPLMFTAICSIVIFFFVFPDGRFVPRWARLISGFWVVWTASWLLATRLNLPEFYYYTYYAALAIGVGTQIYRYRRSTNPVQRQQTKWVVFGITLAIAIFLSLNIAAIFSPDQVLKSPLVTLVTQPTFYLAMSLIPLSIGMAIFRHHLWDIDNIINRTLVYVALTASVVGLYIISVGYLATLFQTSGNLLISLLSTGLVAVLFQPLRDRLQRTVNRLLYGERDDPYAVISRLGQRLEATLAPEAVLPAIVETVAQALKLPYVAIALERDGELVIAAEIGVGSWELEVGAAVSAQLPTPNSQLPLIYQGEAVGQLILAPRAVGESFSPADRRLLDDLARQAGVAAHAVRLTSDLQRSRERLVSAREEERRRLRRDLHDGLGPQLASVTLKLDAARNLLNQDPAAVGTLLTDLKTQTQAAIADIRRLVYDLRPPALDDLGLVSALREQIGQYQYNQLSITIDAPANLPSLPAAVEVAAYRIAQEALTNVVRHSGARNCIVSLGVGNGLYLDIRDDGRGLPEHRHAGVGLSSMRERATELGGNCEIGPAPGGGTCVMAWLPLP
ncbi:MAG TPA: histidine kinase [Roseiflexaceae bacterium]|nr:histidine kinase [Roseiflexaceae bacterium]